VHYLVGRWAESAEALARSIELAQAVGGVFGTVLGSQRLGLLETGQGRYEQAHVRLVEALAQAHESHSPMVRGHGIGRVLATLAYNRLEAGDLARAADYLAQGFAMQRKAGDCPSCDVLLYPAAVPIFLALGDLEQAEAACSKAEETALSFSSRAWAATARYLRGVLSAAAGEHVGAVAALRAALGMFEALQQTYEVARTLTALAEVAEACRTVAEDLNPVTLRQRAAELYDQLGAALPSRRLTLIQPV
jgi:tetratricopeptide (TPR) repeat protein